jgi:hypothetical protein
MLIQPILVVTFINFICAIVGWAVINGKQANADRTGTEPDAKTAKLTSDESSARGMMISNFVFSGVAFALAGLCYLAETGTAFPGADMLNQHGKWAVLVLMVINLGLSAGAFAKINSVDKCVTEGYLKHSRNSMLVNTILGLLGALFVFDKVPTFASGSDMFASLKGLFSKGENAPAPVATAL